MDQNAKCPSHGGRHTYSACSDIRRIMEILNRLFKQEDVEIWLNWPHPDLGGKTPQQAINEGYASAVCGMLESALMGIPT